MTQQELETKIKTIHARGPIFLDNLLDDEIYALLAWEMWKDSEDWDLVVADIHEGIYLPYNTRESASNKLINTFRYKNNPKSNPLIDLIDIIQKYMGGRVTDCGGELHEQCIECKKYPICKRNYDLADALDNLKSSIQ